MFSNFESPNITTMYIKNQTFKDEDTLLEMLFDFSLGTPGMHIQNLVAEINKGLEANEAYIKYRDSLQDVDDRAELYEEERDMILAEKLMKQFESFVVKDAKLYGVVGGERILLYEIDLW